MCIIAAKLAHAQHPTEDMLKAMWNKNPDGAGFAYPNVDGDITIIKGLMTYNDFRAALEPLLAVPTAFYLLHFRIATHGLRDGTMTHPFWAKENKLAICHNGILPYSTILDDKDPRSDTAAFTEDILSKLPEGWHLSEAWHHIIEEYMGRYNKIAIIEKEGIVLMNRSAWVEDKDTGLIFSNSSYVTYKAPVYDSSTSSYNLGGNQAANFRVGARTPTQTGVSKGTADGPGIEESQKDHAARMAAWSTKREALVAAFGKRLGSFVRSNLLTVGEARTLKAQVSSKVWMPEEGEDFLDFYALAITQLERKNPTVVWAMDILGTKTFEKVPDMLIGVIGAMDEVDEDAIAAMVEARAAEDAPIDLGTSSTTLNPAVWSETNAGIFVGKPIAIRMDDKTLRIGSCTAISKEGISYTSSVGHECRVSWACIDDIETRLVLTCPRLKDIQRHRGCRITVEPLTKTHLLDGVLDECWEEGFTLKSDMGFTIDITYDETLSITIDGGPEAKAMAAAK